jgi:DNA polymerase-3 subunit beta
MMNIVLDRSQLLPSLAVVSGVVERRHTLPILGNMLVSADSSGVTLRATDLELEIGTHTGAQVKEAGATTLPARKLMDICRSLPEGATVTIRTDGDRAALVSGRSRFMLSTLSADNFPAMDVGDAEVSFEVEQGVLRRLFEKTAFAMAQQDVRYYLNGVMLELAPEGLVAVATDGHRLAKATAGLEDGMVQGLSEPMQIIVPAKTVLELKRLLSLEQGTLMVELSQRTLRVSMGGTVLCSKLVEGRYPEYQRVIPKGLERHAVVQKDALRAALQRTAILSNEKYKGVRVTFEDGTLALQSHNPEKEEAEDELEIDYRGDSTTIGFNVGYILDALGAVDEGAVEIWFRDGDSSAVWHGLGQEDETFVIMPMRL